MCIAVPARVDASLDGGRTLVVSTLGFLYSVCGELAPAAAPGDWVLVHMGFALTVLDQDAAQCQLDLMERATARSGAAGDG